MSALPAESAVARIRRRPGLAAVLAIAALVVASTAVRIAAGWNAPGPWIFVDELIYSELGRSAFGTMGIRGYPLSGYGTGYPLVIGPAYAAFPDLVTAFGAVKAVNSLVMSLVAIPVYVTARTILDRRWSAVAALLAVLVPGMAYSSVVMTENAFYPAFGLSAMLIVLALRRPRLITQVLVFAGIVLCFEIRSQGAVLAVAYLAALVAVVVADAACAEPRGFGAALLRSARRYWASLAIFAVGLVGGAVALALANRSIGSLLGAYAVTTQVTDRYHAKPIAAWSLLHVSELALWLGVLPFVALLVLLGAACRRSCARDVRVFAIASAAIVGSMTVVVAAFVVFSNVGRIEERNLFYVGILPLIALCWWVADGLPRSGRWFTMALVIGAGMPLAIPYPALLNETAASDTLGLYLPWALVEHVGDLNLIVYAVAAGSFGVAALALLVPRRWGWLLVATVVAYFAISTVVVDRKSDHTSRAAVAKGISGQRDWIDAAIGTGGDATVVYPGSLEPLRVWQNEFFNRSIRRVWTIGVPLPGGLPEVVVNAGADGRVVDRAGNPLSARHVLAHDSTTIAGAVIARDAGAHMQLVRVEAPLRFVDVVTGIYDDGWTGPGATYTRYRCDAAGAVTTTVRLDGQLHAAPVAVTPTVEGRALEPVMVDPGGAPVRVRVPVEPQQGVCAVAFAIEPVAVPAANPALGSTDPRPLGVLMSRPEYAPS